MIIKLLSLALFLALIMVGGIACADNTTNSSLPSPVTTTAQTLTPAVGQQLIIDEVVADLKQQGVPVISARLISYKDITPPIVLEFTLQSAGDVSGSASENMINTILVYRIANLSQRDGLNIGGIGIILIDNQGKQIVSSISVVTDINDLPPLDSTPYAINDAEVTNLLKQQVLLDAPSTVDIQVSQGIDNLRGVVFDIHVKDIRTANDNIKIVSTISRAVTDLNSNQDARIFTYRIDITDASGEPLLKLTRDFTAGGGGSISSWEAEGLENWGYPSPPPEETLTTKIKDFFSRILSAIGIHTES